MLLLLEGGPPSLALGRPLAWTASLAAKATVRPSELVLLLTRFERWEGRPYWIGAAGWILHVDGLFVEAVRLPFLRSTASTPVGTEFVGASPRTPASEELGSSAMHLPAHRPARILSVSQHAPGLGLLRLTPPSCVAGLHWQWLAQAGWHNAGGPPVDELAAHVGAPVATTPQASQPSRSRQTPLCAHPFPNDEP